MARRRRRLDEEIGHAHSVPMATEQVGGTDEGRGDASMAFGPTTPLH